MHEIMIAYVGKCIGDGLICEWEDPYVLYVFMK